MDIGRVRDLTRMASAIQSTAERLGLMMPEQPRDVDLLFDSLVTDSSLKETTRSLFKDGYHALAVEEAFKCVNNTVKAKSKLSADGAPLMKTAFSLHRPILKLNELRNQSQRDQQLGYMDLFSGSMTGIRNPRAHEHQYLDDPVIALEMLSLANHLMRMVSLSKRTRLRNAKAGAPL